MIQLNLNDNGRVKMLTNLHHHLDTCRQLERYFLMFDWENISAQNNEIKQSMIVDFI